ncbi:MAG TPA: RNA polymerase sigma-54 factor, partial [Deltaproteobacteria bacterium]|nr:RNA polymerase sigma-54 factor [Deltaproteobacteria bacterium]
MALELKQQLKLTQQLVMTPQLQQAIKLLQLSRLELVETVRQEMESNPVLEEETFEIAEGEDSTAKEKPEKETNQPLEEVVMKEEPPEDFDWESYIEEYSTGSPAIVENEYFKELPPLENRLVKKASLDSHLMWQLRLSNFTEEERNIGAIIIGNLNSDGYLKASVEEIAEMAESDVETVEKVLERIQEFDPVGVAARDLKECLLIQARKLDPPNELVVEIITNHLHDLENKNYY